jgi:predicted hydrolase (HD superfamily)
MACDELCGIFYAYKKMNPVPYGQMKASSIKKKFADPNFAAKIKREDIVRGVEALGVSLDEHIQNLIGFLAKLD